MGQELYQLIKLSYGIFGVGQFSTYKGANINNIVARIPIKDLFSTVYIDKQNISLKGIYQRGFSYSRITIDKGCSALLWHKVYCSYPPLGFINGHLGTSF